MGELELLEQIARTTPVREGTIIGAGDDAAVLAGAPAVAVTTDVLVDGIHFRREWTTPRDLGHKALAVNLSDLAAMGATAQAAVVALVAPPGALSPADHAELRAGLDALAAAHGATIAGGDLSDGPVLTLAVTAVGRLDGPDAAVTRRGGRPGDGVFVTGSLGGAAAGLLLADDPALPGGPCRNSLLEALLRPQPRLAHGLALARAGAHAMLDCSDGLVLDLGRLAEASGVRARLDLEAVPRAEGLDAVAAAAGRDPVLLAAAGGDDYELIVALDAAGEAAARAAGVPLHRVGTLEEGTPGLAAERAGVVVEVDAAGGWTHGL